MEGLLLLLATAFFGCGGGADGFLGTGRVVVVVVVTGGEVVTVVFVVILVVVFLLRGCSTPAPAALSWAPCLLRSLLLIALIMVLLYLIYTAYQW